MTIKVLGPGCMNCKTLERRTLEALEKSGIQATVEKVVDLDGIIAYGVMRTPGLVINERVVVQGRVPTVDQIHELIAAEARKVAAQ
ncbi:MAG: TM0996/MTH895 family glutaredoxin-like protein [Bacteroidetes bacterium]|nr:TM0996/MTH895 family glutaredoxin-like protein [Bacteroidota bacterium]MCW5896200.1 TM0996/MTH895 family glutaredoxin-like protein [Bacteroidota bacterium]